MVDLDRLIITALKSGKTVFGYKKALNTAKSGRVVALMVASNCPTKILNNINHYSNLLQIPLYFYPSSSRDLGAAFRKPFSVSVLAIREINEPNMLRIIRENSANSIINSKEDK